MDISVCSTTFQPRGHGRLMGGQVHTLGLTVSYVIENSDH